MKKNIIRVLSVALVICMSISSLAAIEVTGGSNSKVGQAAAENAKQPPKIAPIRVETDEKVTVGDVVYPLFSIKFGELDRMPKVVFSADRSKLAKGSMVRCYDKENTNDSELFNANVSSSGRGFDGKVPGEFFCYVTYDTNSIDAMSVSYTEGVEGIVSSGPFMVRVVGNPNYKVAIGAENVIVSTGKVVDVTEKDVVKIGTVSAVTEKDAATMGNVTLVEGTGNDSVKKTSATIKNDDAIKDAIAQKIYGTTGTGLVVKKADTVTIGKVGGDVIAKDPSNVQIAELNKPLDDVLIRNGIGLLYVKTDAVATYLGKEYPTINVALGEEVTPIILDATTHAVETKHELKHFNIADMEQDEIIFTSNVSGDLKTIIGNNVVQFLCNAEYSIPNEAAKTKIEKTMLKRVSTNGFLINIYDPKTSEPAGIDKKDASAEDESIKKVLDKVAGKIQGTLVGKGDSKVEDKPVSKDVVIVGKTTGGTSWLDKIIKGLGTSK